MEYLLDPSSITLILEKIRQGAMQAGLDPTATLQVELAVEETLVNIWSHGYKGRTGPISLDVLPQPGEQLSVIITDQAPPFDPLGIPDNYRRDVPLEERALGGLGIPMMKTFLDLIEHDSLPVGNRLLLVRNVPPKFS